MFIRHLPGAPHSPPPRCEPHTHTLSLSPTLRTRHTHSTALFLAQLPRGPNLYSEGLPPPLPAMPCPLPDPDEGPPRLTSTFPVTPPLCAGPASQPGTRHPPTWFAHVTRHCAVGPTAQDASDWSEPFPASGLRSKQHCLFERPRQEREAIGLRSEQGRGTAFGTSTRTRVSETAERRRKEPNRAKETRVRPEQRRLAGSGAERSRKEPSAPEGSVRGGALAGPSPSHGG